MSALRVGIIYEPKKGTHSHLGSESDALIVPSPVALFSCPNLLSICGITAMLLFDSVAKMTLIMN